MWICRDPAAGALRRPKHRKRRATTRNRTRGGWGIRRALSSWNTIYRIDLYPNAESIRVWLRADAPLPPWVSGRIIDPAHPEVGGSWDRVIPDLDPVAFELAVRANAPQLEVRTVR